MLSKYSRILQIDEVYFLNVILNCALFRSKKVVNSNTCFLVALIRDNLVSNYTTLLTKKHFVAQEDHYLQDLQKGFPFQSNERVRTLDTCSK